MSVTVLSWSRAYQYHGDAVSLAESPDTVIAHVEAVIRARFEHIAKYGVREHYAVYRNGASETAAEQTVQVTYQEHGHHRYHRLKGVHRCGFKSERQLNPPWNQREVNDVTMRHQVTLTAENYQVRSRTRQEFSERSRLLESWN